MEPLFYGGDLVALEREREMQNVLMIPLLIYRFWWRGKNFWWPRGLVSSLNLGVFLWKWKGVAFEGE